MLQRQQDPITVYMGVPTMYSYLLSKYAAAPDQDQQEARWVLCLNTCTMHNAEFSRICSANNFVLTVLHGSFDSAGGC